MIKIIRSPNESTRKYITYSGSDIHLAPKTSQRQEKIKKEVEIIAYPPNGGIKCNIPVISHELKMSHIFMYLNSIALVTLGKLCDKNAQLKSHKKTLTSLNTRNSSYADTETTEQDYRRYQSTQPLHTKIKKK